MPDIASQQLIGALGASLDAASGAHAAMAYAILDRCAEDISLCDFYMVELGKAPEARRNFTLDTIVNVKTKFSGKLTYNVKLAQGSSLRDLFGHQPSTRSGLPEVAQARNDVRVSDAAFISDGLRAQFSAEVSASTDTQYSWSRARDAAARAGTRLFTYGAPVVAIGVAGNLLSQSPTLDTSVEESIRLTQRDDFHFDRVTDSDAFK